MASIKAFAGIRPKETLVSRIAALPYDVYSREEAKVQVEKEPYSFLKIDRAETQLGDEVGTYDTQVYEKARDTLWEMVEKGEFVQDEQECLYLYELTMNGRSQTGLVACASIDDYENGVIHKHENTRLDKEMDRIRHVDVCNAQTGPIFLAYRKQPQIQEVFQQVKKEAPLFDFTSEDGVTHRGWVIGEEAQIRNLTELFSKVPSLYIADGHHRAASAVKVGKKRRQEHPGYDGTEEFNYFLSVIFPGEELMIMDYNRVVKDLNGQTEDEFLRRVGEHFLIECADSPVSPNKKGIFGMYLKGQWYRLEAKAECLSADPVKGLDVSILQDQILGPLLGIGDVTKDMRIGFIGGIRGLRELERRVESDCQVAFSMYPTSIEELFAVADASMLMPPKSTWFEPKLRSGLFIHRI